MDELEEYSDDLVTEKDLASAVNYLGECLRLHELEHHTSCPYCCIIMSYSYDAAACERYFRCVKCDRHYSYDDIERKLVESKV